MGNLPEARLVLQRDIIVTATSGPTPDWVSPLLAPKELMAIQVDVQSGPVRSMMPVAWITPVVFTDQSNAPQATATGQCQVMNGQRLLIPRAWVDPGDQIRQIAVPGQLSWGLSLYLLKGTVTARVRWWQSS